MQLRKGIYTIMDRPAGRISGVVLVVVILVIVIHFILTIAYLLPINPVMLRTQSLIQRYMLPFFEQNWQLFAPNPISDTRVVLVQCRIREDDGRIVDMPWHDITTPYWDQHVANRFGPADRVVRAHTGAIHIIYGVDPLTSRLEEHRTEENSPFNQVLDEMYRAEEKGRQTAIEALQRIASAHCDLLASSDHIQAVRAQLSILEFPPFSERHKSDAEGSITSYYILDWMPYQQVAPLTGSSSS